MEYASPLSPWRKWLAVTYGLFVLFLTFFGDDHGFLIALALMPWFLVVPLLLMLGEILGFHLELGAWWPALYVVGVLTLGGINAAWIAGLFGRTRMTFMGIGRKNSS